MEKKEGVPAWAERAQLLMNRQGLTYDNIAPALGVNTRSAVGHYLGGRRQLSASQAVSLAQRLGCRVGWLLTGEMPIEAPELDQGVDLSPKDLLDRITALQPKVQAAVAALIDSVSDSASLKSSQRGKGSRTGQRKR